jgi:hypothetical protein
MGFKRRYLMMYVLLETGNAGREFVSHLTTALASVSDDFHLTCSDFPNYDVLPAPKCRNNASDDIDDRR